ncbi:Exopolyphosphatase [Fulvivirga imtechensis AK7]|uniref:Exopolyphosphatase n=1 Tax=Fulvivirga imtechensis AK7 TaxID=1237149 RepID=L8JJ72_9BACT|nr:exopolyphosphatase [Fulvivirga imtechensis]ELR68268.1 Exopolyphosphatase [Fulvivirga imtechensis AK7]
MRLAAIDIGSNAIRLQVTNTIRTKGQLNFKKLEYVRFPLRLGQDVFNTGSISPSKKTKFKKLMRAFKLLIDLYEVDDYMACATSAMREAKNGPDIVQEIEEDVKLKIRVIDGKKEALLINNAISSFLDNKKNYLHIDVGGGSTELTIIKGGKKLTARSFKIGSVRRLEHHDSPLIWKNMKKWVSENIAGKIDKVIAVGTGGNINKIFELAEKAPGDKLTLSKVKEVQKFVRGLTMEERINDLQLNPDRADVIIPASEIYIAVMEWAGAKGIIVPDVGLKDGIMQHLYERNLTKEKVKFS